MTRESDAPEIGSRAAGGRGPPHQERDEARLQHEDNIINSIGIDLRSSIK